MDLQLWPDEARFDESSELWLGDYSARELAATYGTPLYVLSERTLRGQARAYQRALANAYAGEAQTAYASKALLNIAVAQIIAEEGLDLDVVSGGELYVALKAGFPAERIHFHGNNKSGDELQQALDAGIGRIVVDNFAELALLSSLVAERRRQVPIWLRLSPGIGAHTHAAIQTGNLDTKFGFAIATGDAERALTLATADPHLQLVGLHAHIGSQIYEEEPLARNAEVLLGFAADMQRRHGFRLLELSPGGGWGVPLRPADPLAPLVPYVSAVGQAIEQGCKRHGLPLPRLILEPGRSLVARAGVALYTVGARKEIPGVRTYVAVDGGMADNIRPALYGASYTALAVGHRSDEPAETVTVAGKFCESGDVLLRDISLPRLVPGDLLAIPMTGAYTLSMASNYNLAPRPALLLVGAGNVRLVQRRESYADLCVRDLPVAPVAPPLLAKYEALGNDYLVLDARTWPQPPNAETIRRMCDRHTGVGSDGLLWGPLTVEPFGLRLFNPDGTEFEKSGNGLRIFARWLWDHRLPAGRDFAIQTPVGPVVAHVQDDAGVCIALDLGVAQFPASPTELRLDAADPVAGGAGVGSKRWPVTVVDLGNPHCVLFVPEVSEALARQVGPQVEVDALFPRRTNVQFAQVLDRHNVRIEIWERGVGYTLASGTSASAVAAAAVRAGTCASPVSVHSPGGVCEVALTEDYGVTLTGTVAPVWTGHWLGWPEK